MQKPRSWSVGITVDAEGIPWHDLDATTGDEQWKLDSRAT
jgi:hypothetical protein